MLNFSVVNSVLDTGMSIACPWLSTLPCKLAGSRFPVWKGHKSNLLKGIITSKKLRYVIELPKSYLFDVHFSPRTLKEPHVRLFPVQRRWYEFHINSYL